MMPSTGSPMHRHPLDLQGRQEQAQETALLSEFLVPMVREVDLQRLAEMMPADKLRQMLLSLQGAPVQENPVADF